MVLRSAPDKDKKFTDLETEAKKSDSKHLLRSAKNSKKKFTDLETEAQKSPVKTPRKRKTPSPAESPASPTQSEEQDVKGEGLFDKFSKAVGNFFEFRQ